MKKVVFLTLIFSFASAAPSYRYSSTQSVFKGEWFLLAGFGEANTTPEPTTLGHFGAGARGLLGLSPSWYLGVTPSIRFVNQYSSSSQGNYRGYRWELNPTLGIKLGSLMVVGEYELLGSYTLWNKTEVGQTVTFSKLSGYRATVLYYFTQTFLGVFYESSSFKHMSNGSPSSDPDIDPPFTATQTGFIIGRSF